MAITRYWWNIVTFDKKKRQNILLLAETYNYGMLINGDTISLKLTFKEYCSLLDKVGLPYYEHSGGRPKWKCF